ncbi:MAG: hypothetical protein HQL55_19530, partial [Magnetococcales bacterium]|nr:hypothetical protein [Magnetococcales bacterium]
LPLDEPLIAACCQTLALFDKEKKICFDDNGHVLSWEQADWAWARNCWWRLALALARSAREAWNIGQFEKWIKYLESFGQDSPEHGQWIYFERCLWAVSLNDIISLEQRLREWRVDDADPFWRVRKAALLAEINRIDEAEQLQLEALSLIRANIRQDIIDIPSLSREGWALYPILAHPYMRGIQSIPKEQDKTSFERWRELAVYDCNARMELENLHDELIKIFSKLSDSQNKTKTFDPGIITRTIRFDNSSIDLIITATQIKRMTELAGLPSRMGLFTLSYDGLKLVVETMSPTNHEMAAGLVLRLGDKELINNVFSRFYVARLNQRFVDQLEHACNTIIDVALSRRNDISQRVFWDRQIEHGLELLSRLTVRATPDRIALLLQRACKYYQDKTFFDFFLHKVLNQLFRRTMKALPPSRLATLLHELAILPLPGYEEFPPLEQQSWPEPFYFLPDHLTGVTREPADIWEKAVHRLLSAMGNSISRFRAASRLHRLNEWGLLTREEMDKFGEILWSPEFRTDQGMPGNLLFHEWAFFFMPEPEPGLAEQAFRSKWLVERTLDQRADFLPALAMVGRTLDVCHYRGRSFPLSDMELKHIRLLMHSWSQVPESKSKYTPLNVTRELSDLMSGFGDLLLHISVSSLGDMGEILEKVNQMEQVGEHAYDLYPGLCRALPEHVDALTQRLRRGLTKQNDDVRESAWRGLHKWMIGTGLNDPSLPQLPNDLMREIGTTISMRRKETLDTALKHAIWIFTEGSLQARDLIRGGCLNGLGMLLEELDYSRSDIPPSIQEEIPGLRHACIRLAVAMDQHGLGQHVAISDWVKAAETDPLPEVRHELSIHQMSLNTDKV